MAIGISGGLRDGQINNVKTLFDGGVLEIRDGTRPGTAGTAPTGTVLASITLPGTAFVAASGGGGQITLTGTWQDSSADAAGTATWFRLKQTADAGTTNNTDERIDGDISTVAAGTGDLQLDNTSIASGQTVSITSFTITQPASA